MEPLESKIDSEVFDEIIEQIKVHMNWNILNEESVYRFSDEDKERYPEAKNPFTYECHAGSSIITEIREAMKTIESSLKIITLDFINWGDTHEYEFDLQFRKGQEPDAPIEDDTDYSEAMYKSDKHLDNVEPEYMDEYEEINSVDDMVEFLDTHANDRIYEYISNGSVRGLAEHMISERTAIPGTEGGHQIK